VNLVVDLEVDRHDLDVVHEQVDDVSLDPLVGHVLDPVGPTAQVCLRVPQASFSLGLCLRLLFECL
jgi:hypothetical protein